MVAVAVVLTIAGGVVLAAPVGCTGVDCIGTREADTITGSDSFDRIAGMEGNDIISGRHGGDQIFGDEGSGIHHPARSSPRP